MPELSERAAFFILSGMKRHDWPAVDSPSECDFNNQATEAPTCDARAGKSFSKRGYLIIRWASPVPIVGDPVRKGRIGPSLAILWALIMIFGVVARAAPADSDWPCQQIKVPHLSLAAVWSGPAIDPQQSEWKEDQPVADLVQKLAPRRQPIDRAQPLIHDFADQAGDAKQPRLLKLLAGIFNVLDAERDSVISGLDRFGGRQKELAGEIRTDNERLRALQTDQTADPEAVQQLTRHVTLEAELFQDRRTAIGYACEVPSKIEQRLFTLAHQIQSELE